MNMKKTIAAVAACAMAVSAMATTVSAEEGSLHYNLVKTTSVRWMPALMTIIKLLESVAKSVLKNGVQKKTGTII